MVFALHTHTHTYLSVCTVMMNHPAAHTEVMDAIWVNTHHALFNAVGEEEAESWWRVEMLTMACGWSPKEARSTGDRWREVVVDSKRSCLRNDVYNFTLAAGQKCCAPGEEGVSLGLRQL